MISFSWTHYITYDHFLWQTITLKILSYTELDYVPGGAAPRLSSSRCGGFPPRRRIAAGAVAMQSPCRVYIYINTYISIYIYTHIYIGRSSEKMLGLNCPKIGTTNVRICMV